MTSNFLTHFPTDYNFEEPSIFFLMNYQKIMPQYIINLWKSLGFGSFGNGILKLINPKIYKNNLLLWLDIPKTDTYRIPFAISAFGDIFYLKFYDTDSYDILFLSIHHSETEFCGNNLKEFFEVYITNPDIQNSLLKKELFQQSVAKIGVLPPDQIYIFVPCLEFGGFEHIEYVSKANAYIHQRVLYFTDFP